MQAGSLTVSAGDMGLLVVFGAFNLGLGMACFVTGARLIPSALATLLSMAETMLAPVWVGLVHGEVPATRTIFGGVIILAALIGYLTAEFLRQRRLNTTGRAMPPIA